MRLYLSSQGLGNFATELAAMAGDNKRMLFIDNAKDDWAVAERADHVREKIAEFEALGFECFELDLRDYFGRPEILQPIVAAAGLVWASGGNTFLLRRAMHYSGLDEILPNLLREDALVYGGSSAGAIIMTKTLRGVENGDDPYVLPAGYKEEIIWNGLGLVYPQLVPHYESSFFKDEAQAMADYYDTNGLKYETLKDGEVYIVHGDIEEKRT